MGREHDAGGADDAADAEHDDIAESDDEDEDEDEGSSLARLRALARPDPVAAPVAERAAERQELLDALRSPSEAWRLTALQGLLRFEPAAALADAADALLRTSGDPFLQASARLVLAEAGRADADDLAQRALGRRGAIDEARWPTRPHLARRLGLGWPLRRLAALALGHTGAPGRPTLRVVLATDPDWAVREAAVVALTRGRAPGAFDADDRKALEAALRDRRGAVRRVAAAALGLDEAATPVIAEDSWDAWRVPGREPYFRYVAGPGRREYSDELEKGTRDGLGRNWHLFEVDPDEDEVPDDVPAAHPLVEAPCEHGVLLDDALTRARDLVHQPAIAWPVDPLWPVCCGDYAVFHGHAVADAAPAGEDPDEWFLDSLESDLPYPEESLEELEAETYAFRCGRCGWWWTSYRQ